VTKPAPAAGSRAPSRSDVPPSPADSLHRLGERRRTGALATADDAGRRILYLMLVRTVLISLVLGSQLVLSWFGNVDLASPSSLTLFAIIGTTYLLTLIYALAIKRGWWQVTRLADVQIAGDLVLTTLLVHATGGAQSAFTFFFALSIIGAAAVRFREGALVVALASSVLFVMVSLLGWTQVLPVPVGQRLLPWDMSPLELVRWLAVNLAAFAGVAVLAFNLGAQVQRTTASLATQTEVAADLYRVHEDIVRSLASGLVTIDTAGKVLTMNQMASEILGVRYLQAAGKPIDDVIPGLSTRLNELPAYGAVRRVELTVQRGETSMHLGTSVSPLRDNHDRLVGRIVNFQDLTELRQMEVQVRRGERMAAIGALASGIAHEIRNPLASMSGSIELLRSSPQVSPDDGALMNIVTREIDRLNVLITDLLDYANPHPRSMVSFDLALLVRETLEVFRRDPGIGVEVRQELGEGTRGRDEVVMVGDPSKLRQVLWNLLRNAADAAAKGGKHVTVRVTRHDKTAEFAVTDDGAGIPPEHLQRIFDPFFTTKSRGTGLGLATCHGIVTEHNGTIDVKSQPGRGTTFLVRLPVEPLFNAV
jgi:two-component system, NtrC family, sensor histidine kinase PilS